VDSKRRQIRGDSIPVIASFKDIAEYCNKRSHSEGYAGFYEINGGKVSINPNGNGYRIPNKPEYIYAATGGAEKDTHKHPGGDKLNDIAWYGGNSGFKPHEVGKKNRMP
jgi:formylglycine-generating enzyme required for sulfatase activity